MLPRIWYRPPTDNGSATTWTWCPRFAKPRASQKVLEAIPPSIGGYLLTNAMVYGNAFFDAEYVTEEVEQVDVHLRT